MNHLAYALRPLLGSLCALLFFLALTGCQSSSEDELIIYSGRSQALVEGLVERFEGEADVEVRYGTDAQLLALLQEEGDQSEADLFWANTAGALGEAINGNLLATLPDSLRQRAAAYRPSSGRWTPVTTRFRVLAYNADAVSPDSLPASVMNLPDFSQYAGRIGWTPAYSSFQDFITAARAVHGRDSTLAWLEAMQALEPKSYTSNTPMIEALAAGEIDIALTNHYYVLRLKHGAAEGEYEEEEEEEHEEEESARSGAPVDTYHFASGDVGNLALVTGAGLLQTSQQPEAAQRFLSFLLSPEAQRYAAQEVHEYPVTRSAAQLPPYMMPVDSAIALSPDFDFDQLRDLDATLQLLREAGVL